MLDGWTIVGVVRVEDDAAGVDLGPDVAVGEQHADTVARRRTGACGGAWTTV